MITLAAPNEADLRRWAAEQAPAFTYTDVGTTRRWSRDRLPVPPPGFVLDRRRIRLGTGDAIFAGAQSALFSGRMFPRGWLRAAWPEPPLEQGAAVGIAARCCGVWWWNAARIIYVETAAPCEAARIGHAMVAYGTLASHVETGEERFLVEQLTDGGVWYEIAAFSRPRHPLVRAAYPLARRMQRRFGEESLAAMQQAVRDTARPPVEPTPVAR